MSCGLGFRPHRGNGSTTKSPSACLHPRTSNKTGANRAGVSEAVAQGASEKEPGQGKGVEVLPGRG